MSVESWIDTSVFALAVIIVSLAGLVDASLQKRQRLTIRELLDGGTNGTHGERGDDQVSDLRAAVDVATLLGVLLVGLAVARLSLRAFDVPGLILSALVSAILLLLVARVIPTALVNRYDLAESGGIQRIGIFLAAIVGPFLMLAHLVSSLLDRPEPAGSPGEADTQSMGSSTHTSAEQNGEERDDIEHDEHVMISGILSMEDAVAREIMVPRTDVVAVEISTPVSEVVQIAQDAGHSRIPVFEESIDRVRGIVYAKDLLRFVSGDVSSAELSELMRPAMFVPESKRVDDLLRDLRRSRVHMAVVVDEYGGTAGVVTIEDIIEEIVGEIQDEYDREVPLYEIGSNGEVIVDGRMGVDELSEVLGVSLPETESETVGGFVQRQLGHIPEPGESISTGDLRIQVERVERRRVRTLTVYQDGERETIESPDSVRVH